MAERRSGNAMRREAAAAPSLTAELRDRITGGALALGARISDKELALEFGLSRTPVRESLLQLQSEGLVVIRPQSGTFVFDPTDAELRQICDARAIMETGALRLLLARKDVGWAATLQRLVKESAAALRRGDGRAFDHLDCRFHETMVEATGNAYLARSYGAIAAQLRALRQKMPPDRTRLEQALEQHRRILALAKSGRVEEAAEELTGHVGHVASLLTRAGA